ncbi:MAG: hypothetical protein AAGH38_06110, partial [Pseudomonadota bacterium]
ILTAPFRWLSRIFGSRASRAAQKAGAGYAARRADSGEVAVGGTDETEEAASQPSSRSGFLFTRLARPMLAERTAADLSLDEAREHAFHAQSFYANAFTLFPRGDFFYEEVEQEYLDAVLGKDGNTPDGNFLGIMALFRRVVNGNSSRLFVLYQPFLLLLLVVAVVFVAPALATILAPVVEALDGSMVEGPSLARYVADGFLMVIWLALLLLLYHWPYKVTQQQNLLGLDNYITSKFSRINQNFQVAKRRAMNIERNMRMHQADDLRQEAGDWTIAYNWLAFRLFFCEQTVRNAVYQIRRNTALYGLAGLFVCAVIAVTATVLLLKGQGREVEIAVVSLTFVGLGHLLALRRATAETLTVLQPREWNRFHLIELDQTIRDHVGEDKLQIVTFRDRNRME